MKPNTVGIPPSNAYAYGMEVVLMVRLESTYRGLWATILVGFSMFALAPKNLPFY